MSEPNWLRDHYERPWPGRAELERMPGQPWPPDLPEGTFICSWRYDRPCDRYLVVTHADPRLLISGELLETIIDAPSQYARVTRADGGPAHIDAMVGDVFHVYAENGHWAYRIESYVPQIHAWIAEWPDLAGRPRPEAAGDSAVNPTAPPRGHDHPDVAPAASWWHAKRCPLCGSWPWHCACDTPPQAPA